MNRIWHPYHIWEDYRFGMWSEVPSDDKEPLEKSAIEFMENTRKFKSSMRRVIYEWPISSEQNLSSLTNNPRAWIGQAACAIELKIPEHITRLAWGKMKSRKRVQANKAADSVIDEWRANYEEKNHQIHLYMGTEGLSQWNTRRSRPKTRGKGIGTIIQANLQGDFEKRCGFDVFGV